MDKEDFRSLGISSGLPAFPEFLHVGRPNMGDENRLMERFRSILDRRYFTNNGPLVQEFEAKVAEFVGVKHCVAMCNATLALEIVIRALELKGEVILPSLTFIATAHALQWQEITPVFADITPGTHHLDPEQVERVITPRTTGIIGVHLWGRACDVSGLADVARRRGLRLLFDAAHGLGCSYQETMIGGFGDAEVFSFHATKFCNSFEGGAVVTNNDELAAKMRLMRNFGFAGLDRVIFIGTNGKMTEVCAAMGLTSLESIDRFIAVNRANYQVYREELGSVPGLTLFPYDKSERANYQYVVFEVDRARAGLSRDQLIAVLKAENVLARRYFWPGCHRMEPHVSYQPNAGLLLPNTERVAARLLSLPTGTAVGEAEIRLIARIIKTALRHPREVKRLLGDQDSMTPDSSTSTAALMLPEDAHEALVGSPHPMS